MSFKWCPNDDMLETLAKAHPFLTWVQHRNVTRLTIPIYMQGKLVLRYIHSYKAVHM